MIILSLGSYVYEGGPTQNSDHMEFADTYYVIPGFLKNHGSALNACAASHRK